MKHLIFICIAATRAIAPGHSLDELYRYTSAAMEMVATAPEKNDCIEDVSSTNAVEITYPTMESVFASEMPSNSCGHGWSASERKQAFDDFLIAFSMTNHTLLSQSDEATGSIALMCCMEKKYTNALSAAWNILNSENSPYKGYAVRLLLDIQMPTVEMSSMILSTATNPSKMTAYDRYKAVSTYVHLLTGRTGVSQSVITNAANLFFEKRHEIDANTS